ncbi:AAA family ATPase [Kitasatospora viridis]|uniref:Putative ATPase n=1 Tax=Kitasatospora viridis TaxID=281105 RepID=A0A561TTR9_9ACTN|nr:AAA family ATPase [Kitasatospora viridis]TWF90500.1 putative ATPase [Kitasatospora viridis]
MRRFILTGTPGAGKTTLLHALAARGHSVIEEAATDVIAEGQAAGVDEPWAEPGFVERVVTVQRERQLGAGTAAVQLFDRSPVCTYTLAEYLGLPVAPALRAELERIATQRVYQPTVFFVRNLGFCEPTPARRISFADSLEFERVHRRSYREFGFALLDVPAAPLAERVALVEAALAEDGA